MHSSLPKSVSNLDLKYLDQKFIAIRDDDLTLGGNLHEIRRQKAVKFPSLIKSVHENADTTINQSFQTFCSRPKINKSLLSDESSCEKSIMEELKILKQKKQIDKYRCMIKKIKTENNMIHKEISILYKLNKEDQSQPKTKPVKGIRLDKMERKPMALIGAIATPAFSSEVGRYDKIYESLRSNQNPYSKEAVEIQKKFANNNLDKNFESFCVKKGKRVPEFIKSLR